MNERRLTQRRRVLKGGRIVFNHSAGISCTVRNISDGGACLMVESPLGIPEAFTLVVEADRTVRPSRVVWAAPDRVGVAFES